MKRAKIIEKERVRQFDEMTDDAIKYGDLLEQHLLPCSDDLILLTLKGHLIIENLLETILIRLLIIERLPEDKNARLGFYQKLKLVEAVVCVREPGPNADLFCAIAKLNSIRNQLAHNLKNPSEIESDIKSLVSTYFARAGKKPDWTQPLHSLLRKCLISLCHFLYKVRHHFYKLDR